MAEVPYAGFSQLMFNIYFAVAKVNINIPDREEILVEHRQTLTNLAPSLSLKRVDQTWNDIGLYNALQNNLSHGLWRIIRNNMDEFSELLQHSTEPRLWNMFHDIITNNPPSPLPQSPPHPPPPVDLAPIAIPQALQNPPLNLQPAPHVVPLVDLVNASDRDRIVALRNRLDYGAPIQGVHYTDIHVATPAQMQFHWGDNFFVISSIQRTWFNLPRCVVRDENKENIGTWVIRKNTERDINDDDDGLLGRSVDLRWSGEGDGHWTMTMWYLHNDPLGRGQEHLFYRGVLMRIQS